MAFVRMIIERLALVYVGLWGMWAFCVLGISARKCEQC